MNKTDMKVERELMLKTLRESEERYRSVFENTGTATVIVEENSIISMANAKFEKLSGYSLKEIEGKKLWTDFVAIEDLEKMKKYHVQRRINGEDPPTEYEFRFVDSNGDVKDVFLVVDLISGTKKSVASVMDVTPLKKIQETLRQSEARYRDFFEASKDAIYIRNMDGTFVDMNDSGLELFGIDRRSLSKITASDIYAAPFDRDTVTDKIIKEGFVKSYESSMRKMDGTTFPATITSTAIKNSAGEITGFQGIIRDETDRKRAEEKIRRSLREKEALLAEIHHRVKNNMQIISSLLSLQSRDIKDEKALSLIKNCEDRIISMSLVHEKLYLSEDLSRIDFGNYITSITAMLFQSYRVDSRIVNFTTHIEDAFFGVETAIPLGLIVNELISNAMKHAFPNNRRGDLTVELARSDKADTYKLTVTDDGVGLPYGIDYKNTKTFGIQLIYMLTEQLNGEVGFESDSKTGTSFKITFRERRYGKGI